MLPIPQNQITFQTKTQHYTDSTGRLQETNFPKQLLNSRQYIRTGNKENFHIQATYKPQGCIHSRTSRDPGPCHKINMQKT
jgi:hypothetical protein